MSKFLIYTLRNQNSPAPGSPVTVLPSGTAFPISSTKLVPLKRRRSSLEDNLTSPRTSKMNYFVASATVVSMPVETQPLFENVRQGLKYSVNDSCHRRFRPPEFASLAPPIACSDSIDASRAEYHSDDMNCQLPMEQTSDWSFMPALPSFLRPLPPLDSIGTLESLPVLLDRSLLKPLPPVDVSGGQLDQLFDDPRREGLVGLEVSPVLHTEETPLAQLLTTMQEYNQEVLESKDASTLAKNAKKRLDRPPKPDNLSKAQAGKQVRKPDGDDRLNTNIPRSLRNSRSKKAARKFAHQLERRMYSSNALSKAAQLAIRTGKWRRNTRVPQDRRSADPVVPTGDSRLEVHLSTGSSPMSMCSVLDLPVPLAVEISSDPPNIHTTNHTRSPSNDAFSISSTPQNIPVELPSENYPPIESNLPDFQTTIGDDRNAVIAKDNHPETRSNSLGLDGAWQAVMTKGAGLGDRPKSPNFQSAFEDAWKAVVVNAIDASSPPHQPRSPLSPRGSCSPIPGLAQPSWVIPPEEQAENQDGPSWATPPKRRAPPSPTWSPPPDDTWYSPDSSSKLLSTDGGISLKEPVQHLPVIPASRHDRTTPNLRLLLSPEPTLTHTLYNRYSEDVAFPTPIDDTEEQLPPITPLDLLEPVRPNAAIDANSLFDGDLSEDEGSIVADKHAPQRRRPRTPSPISTRAITFTRTAESHQLPTPSSLSPQPPPRFPIRLRCIRSIAPMYLSNEVQSMLYDLEADAQEQSSAKNLLKAQLWREKKAGKTGELGSRVQRDRAPVIPISTATLDAVISNALVALCLRDAMTKKDDDVMVL